MPGRCQSRAGVPVAGDRHLSAVRAALAGGLSLPISPRRSTFHAATFNPLRAWPSLLVQFSKRTPKALPPSFSRNCSSRKNCASKLPLASRTMTWMARPRRFRRASCRRPMTQLLHLQCAGISRLRAEILVPAGGKRRGLSREQLFEWLVNRSAGPEACHSWRGSVWQSNGRPQFSDVSPTTGKPTMRGASTVAWEIHHRRPKPAGVYVLHALRCIRVCVNALHLRLGSQRENLADARAEGSLSRRLTAEQAREIVKLAGEGLERHELAERDKSNGG